MIMSVILMRVTAPKKFTHSREVIGTLADESDGVVIDMAVKALGIK